MSLLAPTALQAASASSLHFERVGTESGPPTDVITDIYQDRSGFFWIGSRDGLTLYDGHTFRVFEHDASDPTSISDNAIRTIYEDRDSNLWVGTNTGGLNRLDRSTWSFEHFRHDSADPRTISHNSVYAILQDSEGTLWVGTQQGLNRFDPETGIFERFLAVPEGAGRISNDYIIKLYEDRDGQLWVGTLGGGLNLWDPGGRSFRALRHDPNDPRTLSHDNVTDILEDPEGTLWVATIEGLNALRPEGDSFRRFEYDPDDPAGLSAPLVTSLAAGPPGKLWVATHGGGLNELDVESGHFRSWRHERDRRNSLGDDDIIKLLADDIGALWIGTWGGGLNRVTQTSLLFGSLAGRALLPDEVEDDDVTSLLHDSRGGVWIGTRTGDALRMDLETGSHRRYLRGGVEGVSRIVLGLEEDRNGDIWIGTSAGVLKIDPETGDVTEWQHDPRDPESLGPGYVRTILADRQGRVWVGTGEGGLNRLDRNGRVVERFTHDPADATSLSDDYVTALLEDREGVLWVGTRSGGLNALDPETGRAVRHLPDPENDRALSYHNVTSMLEDSKGRLWIGTSGGGVNRLDRAKGEPTRFTRFTERDGLIDNDVMAILEDDDGTLWLSTKRGLSRFDPEEGSFASVSASDGLPTAEFEASSAARGGDTLCFGTVKGLVAIPVGTPFPEPSPSPMVVTSIRTADGEIRGDRPAWSLESLEIPYGEWLSFELAVLEYSPEHRHRYAYRLGDEWVDLGSRREITFTTLRPGPHEFAARGRNSHGVWSATTPTLRIEVVPPFWMTTWFRGAMVLAVVGLAIVGHRVRMSALEKRNLELLELHRQREKARRDLADAYDRLSLLTRRLEAAKEEERQRIARELHDEMGPSLTAVIINLQLLSGARDRENLSRKISDTIELVDRMIQRIRDLSLDLRPPLLDELGLVPALSGYLEAQAERAGVEIEVTGDPSIEGLPAETAITAFRVVQEAVTNVIRHSGADRATVTVRKSNGELMLSVRDDGRGFDVGRTMESASSGKALGLVGMQERVRMLGGEIAIDSAPGRGTEVRVRVPVEVGR